MRLKKLILQGFKSFADRTEFVFDSPITGIVGPNGCGKSNVVDGFKWVLGEQSAKSLRGDAMLDVIFNGSGGRKPAGVAEVTLVFDNPKRADEPLKITSSIASPRRLLADCSPSTHLNASTTLDLPQPLGPTIPVIGESKTNSVRSAKLLKPCRISFFRRMDVGPP